jgi:hypothetical protein
VTPLQSLISRPYRAIGVGRKDTLAKARVNFPRPFGPARDRAPLLRFRLHPRILTLDRDFFSYARYLWIRLLSGI